VKGEDTCFDAACYGKKREAFVKLTIKEDKSAWMRLHPSLASTPKTPARSRWTHPPDQRTNRLHRPHSRPARAEVGPVAPGKEGRMRHGRGSADRHGENAGAKKLVCCNGKCKVHKHTFRGRCRRTAAGLAHPPTRKRKRPRELKRKIDKLLGVAILKRRSESSKWTRKRS